MAELNLEPGEYAVTSLADVSVGRGAAMTDLVLTNRNLLVVSKTVLGRTKGLKKYRLDQIPVINGQAQLGIEKRDGVRQFFIQLKTGERLQITSSQREDYEGFASQINMLLTGTATVPTTTSKNTVDEIAEVFQSTFAILDLRTYLGGKKNGGTPDKGRQAAQAPMAVSSRCLSCKAPINGYSGQIVTCNYCDTEQKL